MHFFLYFPDDKRVMYEKKFLTDIATQNYTKFNIDVNILSNTNVTLVKTDEEMIPLWYDKLTRYKEGGKMFVVNKRIKNDVVATATAVISDVWFFEENLIKEIYQCAPFYDYSTKGKALVRNKQL